MVDLLGKAGFLDEALDFIHAVPQKADASIWGAVLASYRLHKDIKIAEIAARNLLRLEPYNSANYVETLEIEQRKLSRNSNGHNLSHRSPIQAHNIWRRIKLNNGSSREIQMVITFHSEVRFRRITYRDVRN